MAYEKIFRAYKKMGIVSKFNSHYGITKSSSFYYDEVLHTFNCLGCWSPTRGVVKYCGRILHHYCERCRADDNSDTIVNDMYKFFREMVRLRGKVKKEPRVLIIEGNVGAGKTTLIQKWRSEYGVDSDVRFINENLDLWTRYPTDKMLISHREEGEDFANLLATGDAFVRQLYILRQIVEEFHVNSNPNVSLAVIERGIIGSINIARSSPGISPHQMSILETYADLFSYDDHSLCMLVGNSEEESAAIKREHRILELEIRNMTARMISAGEPDLYVDRKSTFGEIKEFVMSKK